MTEELLIQLFTNAPGWVILFFVFREGMKAFVAQQEHDRQIILMLAENNAKLALKCVEGTQENGN